MKRFKAEYHHCKVTVNALGIGKIQIDVDDSDANQWANVKEFAFMIEDDIDVPTPVVTNNKLVVDLDLYDSMLILAIINLCSWFSSSILSLMFRMCRYDSATNIVGS